MSSRLISDVYLNGPSDSTEVAVLVCLAHFADDLGGKCFPSPETIAKRVRFCLKTVERALARLDANGWIAMTQRRRGRPGGEDVRVRYQINVEKIKTKCRNFNSVEEVEEISADRSRDLGTKVEKVEKIRPRKKDSESRNSDFASQSLEPLYGRTSNELSSTPPLPPSSGGSEFESEPLVQEFTAEQQAHLASKPEGERDKWAYFFREENELAYRQQQEARKTALEDAQLRAQMPTVEAATRVVLAHCRQLVHGRKRGKEMYVELAIRSDHRAPHQVAMQISRAWDEFVANLAFMKYTIGFTKFINNGLWCDKNLWPWDRERMHLQAVASIGTVRR